MKSITGIRPTGGGRLHIGHYFSVVVPALQSDSCTVLIANLHAPLEGHDAETKMIDELRRYGVAGNQILRQSRNFMADYYFKLLAISPFGRLENMIQFKNSSSKDALLLTYPVLMTHDIIGYDKVFVGDDQKQHVEFALALIKKFNGLYPEEELPEPEIHTSGVRIMDLNNPKVKMSASNPAGCLFLDDEPDIIAKKIQRTPSDVISGGQQNLLTLCNSLGVSFNPDNMKNAKSELTESILSLRRR